MTDTYNDDLSGFADECEREEREIERTMRYAGLSRREAQAHREATRRAELDQLLGAWKATTAAMYRPSPDEEGAKVQDGLNGIG